MKSAGWLPMLAGFTIACSTKPDASRSGTAEPRASAAVSLKRPAGDATLSLTVHPVRETVRRGQPMEVAYIVRNLGRTTHFDNSPHAFAFLVVGPDGKELRPEQYNEVPELGDMRIQLDHDGIVGRVVDLSCMPYRIEGPALGHPACTFVYSFDRAGEYLVRVRYRFVRERATEDKPAVRDSIVSAAVRIRIME